LTKQVEFRGDQLATGLTNNSKLHENFINDKTGLKTNQRLVLI